MEKMRIVVYCRVATEGQLDMQKESLRRYAEEQGYTVVEEIAEVAKGSTLRRAGIRRIYQLGYNKAADMVLVESVSRISRHVGHVGAFYNKVKGYGMEVETRREGPLAAAWPLLHQFE